MTFKEFTTEWGYDGDSRNIMTSFYLDKEKMIWTVGILKPRHEKIQFIEIEAGTSMHCENKKHAIQNDLLILRNYALGSIQDLTKDIFNYYSDCYLQFITEESCK